MAEPEGHVCVGALAGAFGVHGEVRLKSFCAEPAAIADYAPLVTEDGRSFDVKLRAPAAGRLRRAGDRRHHPRGRRGAEGHAALCAARRGCRRSREDEFYHADLIGLEVLDTGGAALGVVQAVHDHGAGDVIEIARPGQPEVLMPFTRAAVPDRRSRRAQVDRRSARGPARRRRC